MMAGNASNNRNKTQSQNPFIRLIRNSIGGGVSGGGGASGGSGGGIRRSSDTIRIKLLDMDNGELSLSATSSSSSDSSSMDSLLSIGSSSSNTPANSSNYLHGTAELSLVNSCEQLLEQAPPVEKSLPPLSRHCRRSRHQIRRQRSKSCCAEMTATHRRVAPQPGNDLANVSNRSLCANYPEAGGLSKRDERHCRRRRRKHFSHSRHKCHGGGNF